MAAGDSRAIAIARRVARIANRDRASRESRIAIARRARAFRRFFHAPARRASEIAREILRSRARDGSGRRRGDGSSLFPPLFRV